jgi:diaminopimelate epimerase
LPDPFESAIFEAMKLDFYKYQGTGNDFVLLDNRSGQIVLSREQIARLCDRRFGIGADGLMLLENAADSEFKMVYYNSDGRESTMCGNGGRCISVFAQALGMVGMTGRFSAIDGLHDFVIQEAGRSAKIKMIDVTDIERLDDALVLYTGSPHYVVFCDQIDGIDMIPEARAIRYNERFATAGININFVEVSGGRVRMRTYERGVEGETLSCGTGTVAAALGAVMQFTLPGNILEIQTPGGQLSVYFQRHGDSFTDIWLEGPAEKVFEGSIEI